MKQPGIVKLLGAHDVLTAIIIEKCGFDAIFIGGFGTSASLYGLPDLDFLGMTEMTDATRRMTQRVSIPVVADANTGYGDLHNAIRCVSEFESAGAAGIILEDQVFPKRCGHFGGKEVIPAADMVMKLSAVVDSRNDPDFLFIARTDARETDGLDAAIDRINRYCDAGADVAFIEAPLSVDELEEICKRVEYPKFVNMLAFGKTPVLSTTELEEMGFKMMVAPIDSVLLTAKIMREMAETFKRDGHTLALKDKMLEFDEIKRVLGLEAYLTLRDHYKK